MRFVEDARWVPLPKPVLVRDVGGTAAGVQGASGPTGASGGKIFFLCLEGRLRDEERHCPVSDLTISLRSDWRSI